MRLRATVRIRNNALLLAREKKGLCQRALAELAGVPMTTVARLEKLDYSGRYDMAYAEKISVVLGISIDEVFPTELEGMRLQSDTRKDKDIEIGYLIETVRDERLILTNDPSHEDAVDSADFVTKAMEMYPTKFIEDLDIVKDYYGVEGREAKSIKEIAKSRKICGQWVRHRLYRGESELGKIAEKLMQKPKVSELDTQ